MPLLPYDYLHLVNCPEVVTISDILCSSTVSPTECFLRSAYRRTNGASRWPPSSSSTAPHSPSSTCTSSTPSFTRSAGDGEIRELYRTRGYDTRRENFKMSPGPLGQKKFLNYLWSPIFCRSCLQSSASRSSFWTSSSPCRPRSEWTSPRSPSSSFFSCEELCNVQPSANMKLHWHDWPISFRCTMSAFFWFMDNHLCSQLTKIRLQLETSSRKNNSFARSESFSKLKAAILIMSSFQS